MSNGSESPGKTALSAAGEFIKYSTAFGAGTLAFSVGLVKEEHISYSRLSKGFLIAAWVLLVVSVVTGVLAFSRIPVQLKAENYDLEDKYFSIPGKIHELTFIGGVVALGVSLIIILSKR